MYKILAVLFICSILSYQADSQVFPKEGSSLNYRLIGFSFEHRLPGCKYKVEIAEGNYNDVDSFSKNIVKTFSSDTNKVINEVPSFGKQYTWRVTYKNTKTKKNTNSDLYHFSTKLILTVDTSITRLRVIKKAEKYKDAYVFLDASKTLNDMNGMPVWFLPALDERPPINFLSSGDYKITNRGTITFLDNLRAPQAYEVDYNGNILWKAPNTGEVSGDTTEHYHHQLTRLSNGHYMVLGQESLSLKLPGRVDRSFLIDKANKGKIILDSSTHTYYERMQFGTVIEYDSTGKVVWSWKSSGYFKGSDVYNHTTDKGVFDVDDLHENAFYFSFKNVSRIIKIQYPEGNILRVYGKLYEPEKPGYENPLFHHQHSCRISEDGSLYLYNNNNRHVGSLPTLLFMKEPVSDQDTLKKVWEYVCTTDSIDKSLVMPPNFFGMGSVEELPDKSILACMADDEYTRLFIVNKEKEILWSALPERWILNDHKWRAILEYRVSIITDHKALEQMIWNSER